MSKVCFASGMRRSICRRRCRERQNKDARLAQITSENTALTRKATREIQIRYCKLGIAVAVPIGRTKMRRRREPFGLIFDRMIPFRVTRQLFIYLYGSGTPNSVQELYSVIHSIHPIPQLHLIFNQFLARTHPIPRLLILFLPSSSRFLSFLLLATSTCSTTQPSCLQSTRSSTAAGSKYLMS